SNEPSHKGKGELSDCAGRGNLPMMRDKAKIIAKDLPDGRVMRIAQARCRLDQRIEYFLHVERRPADDLQNIGGSGLLFQGLAELVEQAGVLNSDNGLAGKALNQFDLLVRKGADLLAIDADRTHHLMFLEHGNEEERASARQLHHGDNLWAT